MTQLRFIQLQKADGIARITLARPKHNVLNIDMMNELNSELDLLSADEDLKCLVLLGQGPSFCAGVEVGDHKPGQVHEMIRVFNGIFERLERLGMPVLAAVQGACLGGGMEVAIACDLILANQSAVFGQPEIKLGFFPPYAAVRLPQLVGPAKAIEICATGKRYSADEAKEMGFVNHVWPDDAFGENLEKMIAEIRYNSPLIIRLNKQAVKQHLGLPFSRALDGVSDLFLNTLMKTEDTLEGIASFEEKRRPHWKNR
jgi:cyclohexa-1,5-dienecarbonyl-CoA hydratase